MSLVGCSQSSTQSSIGQTTTQDSNNTQAAQTGEEVHVVGRSWQDGNGLVFGWSATSLEAHFNGTGVTTVIDELFGYYSTYDALNYYQVTIDGGTPMTLIAGDPNNGQKTYTLASNLALGEHTVRIRKLTEANVAGSRFHGFNVVGGSLVKHQYPTVKHLLVIGDSLSAGFGVLGTNPNCAFTPATESAVLAYGPVAADALGAEVQVIAWSGRGVQRNADNSNTRTMPDIFLTPVLNSNDATWDFQSWIPDAVAINLGANDFTATTPVVASDFISKYTQMLKTILSMYPNTHIFCILGPLLSDEYNAQGIKPLTTAKGYVASAISNINSSQVTYLEFPGTLEGARLGCNYHPNTVGQANMANILKQALIGIGW